MKKIILFGAIACSIAFYSCSKDDNKDTNSPVTETPKDSIDPVALSAAVKVANGTSATGDLPATTDGAPVLLTDGYDMRTYYAINNRYVVIYPRSTTGFITGYYVKINGAGNYFKIAFPKQAPPRKANTHSNLREDGDNSDSAIIIKLPAGLKGDTFSVKYAAYDAENRVSNTLTAIVSVVASKDSTDDKLLAGTWRFNREKDNSDDWSDPTVYKIDTVYRSYSCVEGLLRTCDGGCEVYAYHMSGHTAGEAIFSANNQYTEHQAFVSNYLDFENSTCGNPVYYRNGNEAYDETNNGGYAYDASTKTLTIIYDGNGNVEYGDASNIRIYKYTVTELSATKLVYMEKGFYTGDRIAARGSDGDVYVNYYEFLKR